MQVTIQILTDCTLAGLLGAVGLRLDWEGVKRAVRQCRFGAIPAANFIAVPDLTVMAARVGIRHGAPGLGQRMLRPMERVSEMSGAVSLLVVVVGEYRSIGRLGWGAWLAMVLVFELSRVLGWVVGGPGQSARQVVATGTSNRNLALALMVAMQSSVDARVVSAVVGNGLLLILLGLLHVGWWRWARSGASD